jgi:hypothetical protein
MRLYDVVLLDAGNTLWHVSRPSYSTSSKKLKTLCLNCEQAHSTPAEPVAAPANVSELPPLGRNT